MDRDQPRGLSARRGHPPFRLGPAATQAAGCLLVREAGGFVTDFRGRSQPICDAQVLAGNDAIHSKLHKLVVDALKDR